MQHTRRPAAMGWALVAVVLACLFSDAAEAVFWFRVESHKSTCFTEEVGVEAATIHVRYHVQPNEGERHANSEHLGSMSEANSIRPFTVTILKTDNQEVVLSKRVGDLKGSILATIDETAQHVDVCFRADTAPKAGEKPLQLRTEIDHRQKALKRSKIPVRETVKNALPGGLAVETFVDSGGQVEEVLKTQQELAHMYRSLEVFHESIRIGDAGEREKKEEKVTTHERVSDATQHENPLCAHRMSRRSWKM